MGRDAHPSGVDVREGDPAVLIGSPAVRLAREQATVDQPVVDVDLRTQRHLGPVHGVRRTTGDQRRLEGLHGDRAGPREDQGSVARTVVAGDCGRTERNVLDPATTAEGLRTVPAHREVGEHGRLARWPGRRRGAPARVAAGSLQQDELAPQEAALVVLDEEAGVAKTREDDLSHVDDRARLVAEGELTRGAAPFLCVHVDALGDERTDGDIGDLERPVARRGGSHRPDADHRPCRAEGRVR